ncbi:glycosyltransferase [Paucibacter sp. AS339]|uniref:glycosyltransferase n=1 Tax=Paucibacter hankyongi TaxID=3133434 RepID=UPI0030A233E7
MKVFVTVGSMLPFDRLVKAMDAWAAQRPKDQFFAQIGADAFEPKHMPWSSMLSPSAYRERFEWCDLIVSHVGMGTVITASEMGRPLLMMPRRVALAEVTSNHQEATAQWLVKKAGVCIVENEADLLHRIEESAQMAGPGKLNQTSQPLIQGLNQFISQVVRKP